MKVHLISSTNCTDLLIPDGESFDQSLILPLGIASIAAYLKRHGLDVVQTDLNLELLYDQRVRLKQKAKCFPLFDAASDALALGPGADTPQRRTQALVGEALGEYLFKLSGVGSPDLVGISCLYTMQLNPALLLAREIKRRTGAKIVLGGFERSKFAEKHLRELPFIDFFVEDAGELAMLRLCEALDGRRELSSVPGLIYRDGSAIKASGEHPWIDVRELPAPDYAGLPLERYRELQGGAPLLIPHQFIRGCLFKCTFCRFPLHNKFQFKPADQVCEELSALSAAVGSNRFFFLNNLVNIAPKYVDELSRALRGKGFLWCDSARPSKLSRRSLELMRESGCVRLSYGLETASRKGEKLFAKGFTVEEARRTLRDSRDVGIRNGINLIVGYPHETEADLQEDLDFITAHADCLDDVYPYGFNLGESPMLDRPSDFGLRDVRPDGYLYRYADELDSDWEAKVRRRRRYVLRTYDHVNSIPAIGNAFGETGLRSLPLHKLFECRERGLDRGQTEARLAGLLAERRGLLAPR